MKTTIGLLLAILVFTLLFIGAVCAGEKPKPDAKAETTAKADTAVTVVKADHLKALGEEYEKVEMQLNATMTKYQRSLSDRLKAIETEYMIIARMPETFTVKNMEQAK